MPIHYSHCHHHVTVTLVTAVTGQGSKSCGRESWIEASVRSKEVKSWVVYMTKLNLNRGSTLPNNAWDTLLHEQLVFISGETPFVPGHRDPTVPVTQCNGLCHVTLSHTYSCIVKTTQLHRALQTRSKKVFKRELKPHATHQSSEHTERTVRLSRLVSFHVLILCAACNATRLAC